MTEEEFKNLKVGDVIFSDTLELGNKAQVVVARSETVLMLVHPSAFTLGQNSLEAWTVVKDLTTIPTFPREDVF